MRILHLQLGGVDIEPLAQIAPDRVFPLCLGGAAECGQVIRLDAREIVLGLGIDQPEHGIGITLPADVRNAPIVAGDRDARRLRSPARHIGGSGVRRGRRHGQCRKG